MKKLLICTLTLSLLAVSSISVSATTKTDEILSLMPGVTYEELEQSINDAAYSQNLSKEQIEDKILNELKLQNALDKRERMASRSRLNVKAAASSDDNPKSVYTLDACKNIGDIFYEPSTTANVEHGHVGIYYTSDTIVESMPRDGVRTLSRLNKKVSKGSKIFTLDGVEQSIKNGAANWAWSQIGCKYSYNFATNRLTSTAGDKNCSKLVWSAYKQAGNLDIDSNEGLGVYPKDILNHKLSKVYKTY